MLDIFNFKMKSIQHFYSYRPKNLYYLLTERKHLINFQTQLYNFLYKKHTFTVTLRCNSRSPTQLELEGRELWNVNRLLKESSVKGNPFDYRSLPTARRLLSSRYRYG